MDKLEDRYNPKTVEDSIYKEWLDSGHFKALEKSSRPPFSIILPPPNITGKLHIGHAFDHSIQDLLIRWKRMSGHNTLWLPGTDHAGIATQAIVEKELQKEGLTKHQLGREKFLERIWDWKKEYGANIINQMKKLGVSCDWDRQAFTLDENVSRAVRKVFVQLYKKNWIYKGTRLINWSPKLQSALSNLEVDHKEVSGKLYHIKYPIEGEELFITIATTRPETLLGDVAVAVHPEDERYKNLLGKKVLLPFTKRKIPIIVDSQVDKSFGSGAVKITPAHDFNDYEMGLRHNLEIINILNKDGSLNENAGSFKGLSVLQARKKIIEDLDSDGLLVEIENHKHSVGHCSRSNCVIEPFLSPQWFVKMSDFSLPAKKAIEKNRTVFEPDMWKKTYLHWLDILEDWCISRQLWWGHRIPAWYCESCPHITVSEEDPSSCESCGSKNITQEEDVLDTWFSSQLWPFSTMGWPEQTDLLKTFYPTSVLVTGHDIIFFWVSRMMMAGLEFKKEVPFKTVYIHGLVRDSKGVKMSKSLGNSVDPLKLIDSHGADALRMALLSQASSGKDIKFSMQTLETYRNFMNKIWNATRFSLSVLEDFEVPKNKTQATANEKYLSKSCHWIIRKLYLCEKNLDEALTQYRFNDGVKIIYNFVWNEFCDWYLELIKPVVYGENSDQKKAAQLVLAQTLNRIMRMIHPFAPFISEEIYKKLPLKNEMLIVDEFPNIENDKVWLSLGSEEIALEIDSIKDVITAIRNIRGENRISPAQKINVHLVPSCNEGKKILENNKSSIVNLCKLESLKIESPDSLNKCAVAEVFFKKSQITVAVSLEGLVNFEEEIQRINKSIKKIEIQLDELNKRFSNEIFIKKAPQEVIDQGEGQIVLLKSQRNTFKASLKRFS